MAFAINGFGTTLYGQSGFRSDGSFIATEWITLLYVPIIPLKSFRLLRAVSQDINLVVYRSESYGIVEKLPIHWPQVARVYGFVFCAAGWWALLIWLFFFELSLMSGSNVPALMLSMFALICLMGIPLIGVVWLSRRKRVSGNATNTPSPPRLN